MVTVVEMPKLSSTMEQGRIVDWLKEEGDEVEKGEVLFEVETDKANVEVEAPKGGVLRKILVRENVSVLVNTPIALIADSMDEDIPAAAAEGACGAEKADEGKPLPTEVEKDTRSSIRRTGQNLPDRSKACKAARDRSGAFERDGTRGKNS